MTDDFDEVSGIAESVLEPKQRTAEWHMQRLGKVTASRLSEMLATIKGGGWGTGREKYKVELARERMTGIPRPEGYKSAAMIAGIEAEPEARAAYEFAYGVEIEECSFVQHPTIGMSGASPDGKVKGASGLIEIKCPELHTHENTLFGAAIPRKYELQRQWQLACTGYDWCDYVSFLDTKRHPEIQFDNRRMRLFVRRVHRDKTMIAEIENAVIKFLREVDAHLLKLDQLYPDMEAPRPENHGFIIQAG